MGYHFKKLYALSDDSLSDKIIKLTDGNFDKVKQRMLLANVEIEMQLRRNWLIGKER